ncbi:hypothetical protein JCM17961_50040 [Endothiovibrio diazotrophicus]
MIWLALWGLLPASALPADIAIDHSEIGASSTETSDANRAQAWGLDDAEWGRYRSLLQGPLGLRLPNIDPLLALLMASDDPAEQR